MKLAILNVTFDCGDSASVASFWSRVTGWPASFVDMPGNPFWGVSEPDASPRLVFVHVDEPKQAKNRIHLDVVSSHGTQAEQVWRLESLGARIVDDRRCEDPGGWVVMTDPEGNEFCIEGGG
jgi:predicted enzyme related to lactoylglutathione lyase